MFDGCVPGASIVIMAAVVVSIVVMTVVADTESVFVFNFFADWVCLNDRWTCCLFLHRQEGCNTGGDFSAGTTFDLAVLAGRGLGGELTLYVSPPSFFFYTPHWDVSCCGGVFIICYTTSVWMYELVHRSYEWIFYHISIVRMAVVFIFIEPECITTEFFPTSHHHPTSSYCFFNTWVINVQ